MRRERSLIGGGLLPPPPPPPPAAADRSARGRVRKRGERPTYAKRALLCGGEEIRRGGPAANTFEWNGGLTQGVGGGFCTGRGAGAGPPAAARSGGGPAAARRTMPARGFIYSDETLIRVILGPHSWMPAGGRCCEERLAAMSRP